MPQRTVSSKSHIEECPCQHHGCQLQTADVNSRMSKMPYTVYSFCLVLFQLGLFILLLSRQFNNFQYATIATIKLITVSIDLPFLEISSTRNHPTCGPLCLATLTQPRVSAVHPCRYQHFIPFYSWIKRAVYGHTTFCSFIHSSIGGHLVVSTFCYYE